MDVHSKIYDCVIIGGGPAGLTAAEYLGRFLRKTIVIDSGASRASLIPTSHNYPGFAEGISGEEFLQRLKKQVEKYDVEFHMAEVTKLNLNDDIFITNCGEQKFLSKKVILATGLVDEKPALKNITRFTYSGVIRYCPICDGYEGRDKVIGIVGPCKRICKKASFLRTYTDKIILFPTDDISALAGKDRQEMLDLEILLPSSCVVDLDIHEKGVSGIYADGTELKVDVLYPAMGSDIRTDFIQDLDLGCNDEGCVMTDNNQQTNISGLYAIGDLTTDLSQIAVATGQAAIAATAIHCVLPLNPRQV